MILFATFLALGNSCKEKYEVPEGDIIHPWHLSFYLADSLGNNLLPYDLPDTPVINPDDYRVISDFPSTVFFYRYNRFKEFGYSFTFGEDPYVIRTSSLYQSDSVYKVTVCFSEQCDTVIARVHSMDEQFNAKDVFPCGTKWVVWGNDTIYPKSCAAIPVKIK